MKTNLAIYFILLSINFYAQSVKGVLFYVDSLHNIANEKNYKFTRIVEDYENDKDYYVFSEYYKSGIRSMKAISKNKDTLILDGLRIDYYESGNKKQQSIYKNNYINGKQIEWYDNQNKKIERELKWDPKNKTYIIQILQFWNKNNEHKIIDGNGEYEETTKLYSQKGSVKDNFKQGTWTGNDFMSHTSFTETYEKGKLISGISIDENKITYPYTHLEERPHPRNGITEFYKDFNKNLRLPYSAKNTNSNYRFFIEFTVDKNGKLIEPIIPDELGQDFNNEITRVINESEKWIPGKKRGIPLTVKYRLSIRITNKSY